MNHSPTEGAQGSANSGTPKRPDLRDYRGDGSTSDYINDVNEYCDHVERQLAQSEERVKALEGALDPLIAWADTMLVAHEHPFLNSEPIHRALAALILSAAAKMVRESGAVEALELANRRATAHRLDDYYATGGSVDHDYEAQIKTSGALEKLRSISEGEAK